MKKFLIIDSFALLFRAFYALPPLTTKDGVQINAVYGFLNQLFSAIDMIDPDFIVCAIESKTNHRKEIDENYKANRTEPIPEFINQIPIFIDLMKKFNMPTISQEGFEADDVIGSIVNQKKEKNQDLNFYIFTGDNDLLRLVKENVFVYTYGRSFQSGNLYDPEKVKKKYNFEPRFLTDYKALCGDPSDNIPGVRGIGKKTATKLILEFKSIENLYNILEKNEEKILESQTKRIVNLLKNQKEKAIMSKKLAEIVCDLKIDINFEKSKFETLDFLNLKKEILKLGFKSIINNIEKYENSNSKNSSSKNNFEIMIVNNQNFSDAFSEIKNAKKFAFDTETTGLDTFTAKLVGISICIKSKNQDQDQDNEIEKNRDNEVGKNRDNEVGKNRDNKEACSLVQKYNNKGACPLVQKYKTFYFPFLHESEKSENLNSENQKILVNFILSDENPDQIKIAHNLKYDLSILKNKNENEKK